jgi:hypothetical protein
MFDTKEIAYVWLRIKTSMHFICASLRDRTREWAVGDSVATQPW